MKDNPPNKIGAANAGGRLQFRFRGPRHRLGMADLTFSVTAYEAHDPIEETANLR